MPPHRFDPPPFEGEIPGQMDIFDCLDYVEKQQELLRNQENSPQAADSNYNHINKDCDG